MKTLDDVLLYLSLVKQRNCLDRQGHSVAKRRLRKLKTVYVSSNESIKAKDIWCFEQILRVQHQFAVAFEYLKNQMFYDAWVELEKIEITFNSLEKHYAGDIEPYCLSLIQKNTIQYQSLYPYKLFNSPEILVIKKSCSICGKTVQIRRSCGHTKGEIYDGEMCAHRIDKAEILASAVVPNPMSKANVIWISKDGQQQRDNYDYSRIAYVVAGLRRPFDDWSLRTTMIREPHETFRSIKRNDRCPCRSGKKYKQCCLSESGVLIPHNQIIFEIAPPSHLPQRISPNEQFPFDVNESSVFYTSS